MNRSREEGISFCVKEGGGKIYAEGWIPATRIDLGRWMKALPHPWSAAMEATMFSDWIYDQLKPGLDRFFWGCS